MGNSESGDGAGTNDADDVKLMAGKSMCFCDETKVKHVLMFHSKAFTTPLDRSKSSSSSTAAPSPSEVPNIIVQSVKDANSIRGERGAKTSTQMIQAAYQNGLFTLGNCNSPVNREIVPALRHIFTEIKSMKASDPKRISIVKTLVEACRDCQQVQAREILRVFGEMTNQNATFRGQIMYFFAKQKIEALYRIISEEHPNCDKSYKEVGSGGQRAHLKSVYLHLLGENFGLPGINAARADRFLAQAQANVKLNRMQIAQRIAAYCCPERLIRELIADINNQKSGAERLISPKCIFDWVKANMALEKAYFVFYDDERSEDYKGMEPNKPTEANAYNPFLSPKFLAEILVHMEIVQDPAKATRPERRGRGCIPVIDLMSESDDDEAETTGVSTKIAGAGASSIPVVVDLTGNNSGFGRGAPFLFDGGRGSSGAFGGGGRHSNDGSFVSSTTTSYAAGDTRPHKWQIQLGRGRWSDFSDTHTAMFESAYPTRANVPYVLGQWSYLLDPNRMVQINVRTQKTRPVRRVPRS